ncbi:MAG: hypothetical protein GX974_07965 [Clostridiales bacterium]|nr:hypothetical protein [Clostridiales bacterium]
MGRLRYNHGFALVFVIVTITVLLTIGTMFAILSTQNSNINNSKVDYISCHYAARSQVLHSIDVMRANLELIYMKHNNAASFFNEYNTALSHAIEPLDLNNSGNCSIDLEINKESEHLTRYVIKSTSTIDKVTRRYKAVVEVQWQEGVPLENIIYITGIEEI